MFRVVATVAPFSSTVATVSRPSQTSSVRSASSPDHANVVSYRQSVRHIHRSDSSFVSR
jgi:hypothetical protein